MKAIDVTRMLEKRRWTWLGHVLRTDPNRDPKRALALHPSHFREHIRNVREATPLAADRENWDKIFKENRFRRLKRFFVFTIMRCPTYLLGYRY